MRKRTVKKVTAVVLTTALAMSLAACSTNGGKTEDAKTTTAADEPVELTFLTYDAALLDGTPRLQKAIDLYKEVKPNVSITLDIQSDNDSVGFLSKLDLLQLTGTTGDVIQVPSYRESVWFLYA